MMDKRLETITADQIQHLLGVGRNSCNGIVIADRDAIVTICKLFEACRTIIDFNDQIEVLKAIATLDTSIGEVINIRAKKHAEKYG